MVCDLHLLYSLFNILPVLHGVALRTSPLSSTFCSGAILTFMKITSGFKVIHRASGAKGGIMALLGYEFMLFELVHKKADLLGTGQEKTWRYLERQGDFSATYW